VYANVTIALEYKATGDSHKNLILTLKNLNLIQMKITPADVSRSDKKFSPADAAKVEKQVTYSFTLHEPPSVTRRKEQERQRLESETESANAQQKRDEESARPWQEYAKCMAEHGASPVPPAAGVEAWNAQKNPDEGPCIPPPKMKPMEGP
jgi:hypothetical protein